MSISCIRQCLTRPSLFKSSFGLVKSVHNRCGFRFGAAQAPKHMHSAAGSNADGNGQDLEAGLTDTVLKLEEIDLNLYRGSHLWKPMGGRGVFGGQVVGQALVAAGMTKPDCVHVHSLHSYFVKTGDPNRPILYSVRRIRDGRSFSTRSVVALQNGEPILTMQVSYHRPEESVLDYQYVMPEVPAPEDVLSREEMYQQFLMSDILTDRQRKYMNASLAEELPVDIKAVDPMALLRMAGPGQHPRTCLWLKAKGHVGDDSNLHRCVAAYLSDLHLLWAALIPFPDFRPKMVASLDHSMWFHSPFHADEWMLYECESPRSVGARSLTHGRIWKRDGTLAVSVAQEGVIRGQFSKPDSKL